MTRTVKVVLDNITWPDGFIGPKRTYVRVPVGQIYTQFRIPYITGYLAGVYGEVAIDFDEVSDAGS